MKAVRQGIALGRAFQASRLTPSTKPGGTVVLSNHPGTASKVAKQIQAAGLPMTASQTSQDIGIATTAGRKRSIATTMKSGAKAKRQALRVNALARKNNSAAQLLNSGVVPKQNYESDVMGASPSIIKMMRRNAVLCVKQAGTQPCSTTLLRWRLDHASDPAWKEPVRQIQLWIQLWKGTKSNGHATQIRQAWKTEQSSVLQRGVNWSRVKGPLSATVATLKLHGWRPASPDTWFVNEGAKEENAVLSGKPFESEMVIRRFGRDVETSIWKEAASHYMGMGLEKGTPSLEPAKATRRKLVKDGRYKEAAALDKLVCGGAWFHGRGKAGQEIHRTCHRCGSPLTAWHGLWSCPHLKQHQAREVQATQWMATAFFDEVHACRMPWGEGYPASGPW